MGSNDFSLCLRSSSPIVAGVGFLPCAQKHDPNQTVPNKCQCFPSPCNAIAHLEGVSEVKRHTVHHHKLHLRVCYQELGEGSHLNVRSGRARVRGPGRARIKEGGEQCFTNYCPRGSRWVIVHLSTNYIATSPWMCYRTPHHKYRSRGSGYVIVQLSTN